MQLVPDASSGIVNRGLERGCSGGCRGTSLEVADHRQAQQILSVEHDPSCPVWLAAVAYLSAGLDDDD